MEWQKFKTTIGSPLYVCEMPGAQSVSSAVLVRAGTRDEKWPEEAGLAHALEHMMFHGAGIFQDSQALSEAIEKTGGWLNAFTGSEATCYTNGVPPEFLDEALFVLFQQMSNPLILKDKISTEMANIIEEIKMYYDNPRELSGFIFDESLYAGHGLGKNTLGTIKALKSFDQPTFLKFFNRLYHPRNFVFVVAGAVEAGRVSELVNSNFGDGSSFRHYLFQVVTARSTGFAKIDSVRERIEEREIEQANIRFGWIVPPASSQKAVVFRVFCEMLSGGMSSPLFQEVREKRGLCYAVEAFTEQFSDTGDFQIYIGTDSRKVGEAISVSVDVVKNTASRADLLEKVKNSMSGRIKMQSESTLGMLYQTLHKIGGGREPQSLKETLDEIGLVTIEEIEKAVEEYLTEEKLVKAMVLPRKD